MKKKVIGRPYIYKPDGNHFEPDFYLIFRNDIEMVYENRTLFASVETWWNKTSKFNCESFDISAEIWDSEGNTLYDNSDKPTVILKGLVEAARSHKWFVDHVQDLIDNN